MSKDFGEKERNEKWEPTTKEIEDLRTELKKFPQKMIGTKLVSPFDQYLISLKVINLDENGHVWCIAPEGHTRLSAINAKLEWKEWFEQERFFERFPEERQKFIEKISAMRSKMIIN